MILKFFKSLANIPNDKLLHFFYGTISGFVLVSLFSGIGVLLCLAIAVLKEVYDFIRYADIVAKDFNFIDSLKDIAFTVAPSIMMILVQVFK